MERNTKENGERVKLMDVVNSSTQKEAFMRANGRMDRKMGRVSIYMSMVISMMENGRIICPMDRGSRAGLIGTGMKAATNKVWSMGLGNSFGMIIQCMKVLGSKIK